MSEFEVPVYEIRPGIFKTDMTSVVQEKYDKLIEGGLTLEKRWGLPEDIGKIVVALATGEIPYSTGQVITADGGLTISRL
jgi:NAD(P)-dependent dehydrogenase (short-subunit alcohol dehydrogenase family)